MLHGDRQKGFTLLELLVALSVLAFLMVALGQGVRIGAGLWRAQTRRIAATAELDAASRTLRTILTTIPIQPAALAYPTSLGFDGRPAMVSLVAELPSGLVVKQLVDMTINLQSNSVKMSWRPHRHELTTAPAPAAMTTELIRRAAALEFAYWGRAAPDTRATWLDRWDGPALPALIRIRIGFSGGDNRRWPDLVVAPQLWNSKS